MSGKYGGHLKDRTTILPKEVFAYPGDAYIGWIVIVLLRG